MQGGLEGTMMSPLRGEMQSQLLGQFAYCRRRRMEAHVLMMAVVGVVTILCMRGVVIIQAAPYWGSFTSDDCVQSGYRKYYSRLWGISGDWGTACLSTPARVGPDQTYFQHPDVCVDKGIGGMWGEFHVRDTSCDPTWGDFKDDGCRSNGYRQYSSVLWGIPGGSSWEQWCADTPAIVRGIFFPRATRCVNTGLNMWGEFDVFDPCCPGAPSSASPHTELRRPRLLQLSGTGGCNDGDDQPPCPNPGNISSAEQFIAALNSGNYDPLDLIDYLWNAFFQSVVTATTAAAVDFYAISFESFNPPIVRFQGSSPSSSTPYAAIRALLIPTILGGVIVNNNGVFPSGSFGTIDLGSAPAPIICTQPLTGCCLAFGWDNANGRLFLGHVQPDETYPQTSNRADVANYLRTSPVFPSSTQLTYREFFGGDAPPSGYEGLSVNLVGFISSNRIQIFLQMVDARRNVVRRRMLDFRRE